ncbi:MAG: hypothetical protein LBI10_08760 [Deltaproteobacteria bacterium]|nr:hypothetical protein [Deltaproteobacteria bacterium]
MAFGLSATLSQAQTQGFEDEYALANPLAINVKPVSQTGQAQKKVEPLLPGQAIKMEGGGEVRIYSEDGRIQITSQEGSVVLFDGMVKVESKPWLEDRPVLVREAQAGTETKLVPQFRINVGQADVEVVPGQEMRLAGPLIISAVRGTKFSMSVSDDGSSFLNVLEGKVLSMARDGQVELLDAGKKASLTATKFTNFLRNLNVKIPVGGDWRSVDRQVLDQAVSQAFGDSFDFLGGAMEKAKGAKDDISAKMAELTSRVVESPAVASDAPRKNMVAKP